MRHWKPFIYREEIVILMQMHRSSFVTNTEYVQVAACM